MTPFVLTSMRLIPEIRIKSEKFPLQSIRVGNFSRNCGSDIRNHNL